MLLHRQPIYRLIKTGLLILLSLPPIFILVVYISMIRANSTVSDESIIKMVESTSGIDLSNKVDNILYKSYGTNVREDWFSFVSRTCFSDDDLRAIASRRKMKLINQSQLSTLLWYDSEPLKYLVDQEYYIDTGQDSVYIIIAKDGKLLCVVYDP